MFFSESADVFYLNVCRHRGEFDHHNDDVTTCYRIRDNVPASHDSYTRGGWTCSHMNDDDVMMVPSCNNKQTNKQ